MKAANIGSSEAQFQVGLMYIKEEGCNKDFMKGIKWIKRAALQGHEGANLELKQYAGCI